MILDECSDICEQRDQHAVNLSAVAIALIITAAPALVSASDHLSAYSDRIKPLLANRCFSCHGGLKQEAGLRLDTVENMLKGGDSAAAIVPGPAGESLLIARVSDPDPATRMPPESEGEPLTPDQLEVLKEWLHAGAPAPPNEIPEADPRTHWAFQPRLRPAVPEVAIQDWVKNPIDAFIAQDHEKNNLSPQPEASRSVLVRRLFIDLIGLPPTVDDMRAVAADSTPQWYEKLVEQLLADPRHGERWGRHWMDVWRYSDWWGLGDEHRNSQKHLWHWRDWIVESLNADTPYDEMLRQMLAADELYPEDLSKLRATGYLARNYFAWNRTQWLDETVEHVGKGLLGLTMNCSKCHDHKYDPIQQIDYYKMRAFFEPYHVRLDVVPGEINLDRDGIPRVFDGVLDTPTYLFVRGDESRPDTSHPITPGVPAVFAFKDLVITPVSLPQTAFHPESRTWVIGNHLQMARAAIIKTEESLALATQRLLSVTAQGIETPVADLTDAEAKQASLLAALAVQKRKLATVQQQALALEAAWAADGTAPDFHQKIAAAQKALEQALGDVSASGDKGKPLALVGAKWSPTKFRTTKGYDPTVEFPATSTGRRTGLALWITDPHNPLTARVACNHIWMRHMGQPLVASVFDFGRKGNAATHPDLLDWLACELVDGAGDGGWSMKHLHRLIVTSATYRMTSSAVGAESHAQIDPDNRLLWRRDAIRLESQVIRDSILFLAGTLDLTLGGPSVPPDKQADSKRRSLYFFHSNNDRNPFLTAFDEADVKECYQRDRSIVPQQALALANSRLVQEAAARIAEVLVSTADGLAAVTDEEFTAKVFATLLGRQPHASELRECSAAIEAWRSLAGDGSALAGHTARTQLVWAVINHNDFVTLR